MGVIKSGHNSAGFPNNFGASDAVTADALNDHVNDSTFNTTAVDDSTIEVYNSGAKIRLKDSSSTTTGTTLAKLQYIGTNKFLGRTSANDGVVESVDISAIANLLRPKFVVGTEGTDQGSTGGSSGTTNALSRALANPTGDTSFIYNLADFRSDDSDFNADGATLGYKKIVGIYVSGFVQSRKNVTYISGTNSVDGLRTFVKTRDTNGTGSGATESQSFTYFPVNSGQSTFELKHFRNTDTTLGSMETNHVITGFAIIPNLPTS